jgi:acetylornithine deacetylase/succinyl-diaminopimelate desuccinylase-like protein
MPLIGLPSVGNASHFNLVAKVPAVYCGIGQERAHATPEYAEIAELERLARLCILSTFEYLQGRE